MEINFLLLWSTIYMPAFVLSSDWFYLNHGEGTPIGCASTPDYFQCAADDGSNCKWGVYGTSWTSFQKMSGVIASAPLVWICPATWLSTEGYDACDVLACYAGSDWFYLNYGAGTPVRCSSTPNMMECASDNAADCKWGTYGTSWTTYQQMSGVSAIAPLTLICPAWLSLEGYDTCEQLGCYSESPTNAPSNAPSLNPSINPSVAPSVSPSNSPTSYPTVAPSIAPTAAPSIAPTAAPSNVPSISPSSPPTNAPSASPTSTPSAAPTNAPSNAPSIAPTDSPTACVDYYDYKSLDGIDFIHPITKSEYDLNAMQTNATNVQQYISMHSPIVDTFFDEEIVCNDSNVEMCFILCQYTADCAQARISVTPHNDINELKVICAAKQSCKSLQVNITEESKVNKITIWCPQRLSCQETSVSVTTIYDTEIVIQCDETMSCKEMRIELYTMQSIYPLTAHIYCAEDHSCDYMLVNTDDAKNIFINLTAFRYSEAIEIHQMHWKNVNVTCGVDTDHRYIRYDTQQLMDPSEILQSARNEYQNTHRLPCEDIRIFCSNHTDFDHKCEFQYQLHNFSLLNMLNDEKRPNCYWMDAVQLYKAYCVGTCGAAMDYYAYNQSLELQFVFDDELNSSEDSDDEQRRLIANHDNSTSISYQKCREYFGSLNDTEETLSSIDAIFDSVLRILSSIDGSILNDVLQPPNTELMNNLSFILCKNEPQNTVSIITHFVIDSIESKQQIINKQFATDSDFVKFSTDVLSELFGFKIKIKNIEFNTITHKGVKQGVVIAIILSALFIIAVIIIIVVYKRKQERERLEALTTYIRNPMILMIGIAFYEQDPESPAIAGYFRDLDGIHKDIENVNEVFHEKLNYTVYPKQRKQEWKAKEIMTFLEEKASELESNLNKYDGLVVFVSCHGVKYNIVSSDYQLIERTAIHRIFSMDRPAVRKIPRVFVFDCCAGEEDRDATLRTDTMYNTTADDDDDDGEKDEPKAQSSNVEWLRVQSAAATERGKNVDVHSVKSNAPMWLYDEDNPDYKLVTIEASNEGFQSKLDTKKGSYMTVGLTTKVHENIFQNQNKRFLFQICEEIQEELHANGKQQPTYTYYNKMKYIKFLKYSNQ